MPSTSGATDINDMHIYLSNQLCHFHLCNAQRSFALALQLEPPSYQCHPGNSISVLGGAFSSIKDPPKSLNSSSQQLPHFLSSSSSRLQVWHQLFFYLSTYYISHFLKFIMKLSFVVLFSSVLSFAAAASVPFDKRDFGLKCPGITALREYFQNILGMSNSEIVVQDCAASLGSGVVSCIGAAIQLGRS
jgi:hypothetical protein